ncbi:MAG: NYN domain-containing protein [Candidatus Thermoplasmatota archaeon]
MPSKPTIVLVDGDQQVSPALPEVLKKLEKTSEIIEKRVYGAGLAPWKTYFDSMKFFVSPLPPPVDYALMVDAIDLLHTRPEVAHFCIVTADRDFTPLVATLRERGMHVTGIAQGPVPNALRTACNVFLSLDSFSKAALSSNAVPQIASTMREYPAADGWVDHGWLGGTLKSRGFDPRAFGKSEVIDIIDALKDVFEVRPTPRTGGPLFVRLKAAIRS